ncbi:MAG: imidazole glycerol phosphate synthase subunit HisF [Candidatus Woesearchaeota archaeon]|nr:MAG: imidazole glycerol phosphate synthase subunit HisF [Candidatus Woesearchaeota archaeon]
MLKVRVIPVLLTQDGLLKKPVQFKNSRTVANVITIVRVFEARQVDELMLLDIGSTVEEEEYDPFLIKQVSEEVFMPFAYGGGIKSVEQMTQIIRAGAEKIVINTAAVANPKLITEGSKKFGSQCIIVSIDAKRKKDGSYEVYTRSGSKPTGLDPVKWAKKVEKLGAGEILLNSITHEGTMDGYDIELMRMVSDAVKIPIIAAGGAGKLEDFVKVVKEGHASAAAAGSIFHYTPITPDMAKKAMHDAGIPVRPPKIFETASLYKGKKFVIHKPKEKEVQ